MRQIKFVKNPLSIYLNRGYPLEKANGDMIMLKKAIVLASALIFAACAADNSAVYLETASQVTKMPDAESAVKQYQATVRKSVHSQYSYEGLGDIYFAYGDFGAAVNEYTQSLRNKEDSDVHMKRGRAYMKLGFYPDAAYDFTTVISYGGDRAYIGYAERAKAYVELGKYKEALKDIDKARSHTEISAELDRAMAEIYYKTADYNTAKVYVQRAVSATPDDAALYMLRAKLFYKTRDANQAVADYEKAISLNPNYTEAKKELAMALATCPVSIYRNGTKAVELANQLYASEDSSDNAVILAAAYAETGDFDKASELLTKASEKEKDLVKQDDMRVYLKAYQEKRTITSW
jgi:tetratricopeptide (TPR) repeat protein